MRIKSWVQSWFDKYGVATASFSEWKEAVISVIEEKLALCLPKYQQNKVRHIKTNRENNYCGIKNAAL